MIDLGFIPGDPQLPGLSELFAQAGPPHHIVEAARRLGAVGLEAPAERTYTRYYPTRRCVVQWTYESSGADPVIVSAELLSEREALKGREGLGEYLADKLTWVQVFPHDSTLPAITTAVSDDYVRRTIAPALGVEATAVTARAVSYKSWRRCVIEYSAGDRRVYGKLFRDDRGAQLAEVLEQFRVALAAAGNPWTIPETVHYEPETLMLVQDELTGANSLSELLVKSPEDAEARRQFLDAVRAAAAGLAALQTLSVENVEIFDAADALASIRADIAAIETVEPEIAHKLFRRMRPLEKIVNGNPAEPLALAHSAFRHSHVYRSDAGDLSLLDLDNLRLAGASADAGYFLAYLEYSHLRRRRLRGVLEEAREVFLNAWKQQPGFDVLWLYFYQQVVLMKWTIRSFYSLDENWRRTMTASISRVQRIYHEMHDEAGSSISDPLLALAGKKGILRTIVGDEMVPLFWPGAEDVEVEDMDIAYDPGTDCIVAARASMTVSGERRSEQLILTFTRPDHFDEEVARARNLGDDRVHVSAADHYIAEVFPRDYRLPGLAKALDDDYMLRLLTASDIIDNPESVVRLSHEILRFRAHERCVIRYILELADGTTRRYVAKAYDDEATAREVWYTLTTLRSRLEDPSLVVEPLVMDPEAFLVVMENIEGLRVGDLMDEATDPAEVHRYLEMTADALARLHALKLEHDRVKDFGVEIEKLRIHERSAGSVSEEMGKALKDTLDKIEAAGRSLPPVEPSFVHGGFKPTQMLLRDNGKVTVVDFDGSCIGDPAIDVGRFMAKTRVDCLEPEREHLRGLDQLFLERYTVLSSQDVRDRARVFQAMSLVRMASRRFETQVGAFRRRGLIGPSGQYLREALACLELGES